MTTALEGVGTVALVDDCSPLPGWLLDRRVRVAWVVFWTPVLLVGPAVSAAGLGPLGWTAFVLAAVAFLVGLGSSRRRSPALVVEAVATVVVVALSPGTYGLFVLLALVAALAVPVRWGLAAVAATALAGGGVVAAAGGEAGSVLAAVVVTGLSGAVVWSYLQIFTLVAELARTRRQLADAAVLRERERFSRDLHDLLGHSLSVIVVKAQAVRKLALRDPEAAAAQGTDIETIGRRALTEVRQAVAGYRGPGLAVELDHARAALADAGFVAEVAAPDPAPDLGPDVDALFGWVVREAVTNVVRHARPADGSGRARIAWSVADGRARVAVTDSGAVAPPVAPPGSGLTGLRSRTEALSGRLDAGPTADGFRVVVDLPLGAAP